MSFWGENVWRSDKRFPVRTELRPNVFGNPLFLAHYVIGFLLFGKIYRDAKRWRTRTHTKAVIKEGERIHLHALAKKEALKENPGARIRIDTGNGTKELLEGDM